MTYTGKHYSVVEERTPHGRAWVVVRGKEQVRLFFDVDAANKYAEQKDQEEQQGRLF